MGMKEMFISGCTNLLESFEVPNINQVIKKSHPYKSHKKQCTYVTNFRNP